MEIETPRLRCRRAVVTGGSSHIGPTTAAHGEVPCARSNRSEQNHSQAKVTQE